MTPRPLPAELGYRLLALLLLITLTAGLPVALWILGGAYLPHELPTWAQITAALSGPDSGAVFAGLLVLVGWAAWGIFTLSVCLELPAQLRGLPAPRLPGLGPAQQLAGLLVAAVVGVGPLLVAPSPASATPITIAADPSRTEPAPPAPPASADHEAPTAPEGPRYTVQPRDTLGRIAAKCLGDWERFEEIFELNRGRPQPDGGQLTDARVIRPGWVLILPIDASPPPTMGQTVVQPGETLAEIARREGLPSWRPLFDLNVGEPQPGGHRFTDPDLIFPGQVLEVPRVEEIPGPPAPSPEPGPSPPEPSPSPTGTGATAPPTPPPSETNQPETSAPQPTAAPLAATGHRSGTAPADVVAVMAGSGSLLAAGAATALLAHRRRRLRRRRTGRQLAATPPQLLRTEAAVRAAADEGHADFTALDLALRSLAVAISEIPGRRLPDVVAARLTGHLLELRLHNPAEATPPPPWLSDEDGLCWSLDLRADNPVDPARARGRLAPYPGLVSIGVDRADQWLLDLERVGLLRLDGPPIRREDFCRHLAAELAVNAWSDLVYVTAAGFGAELVDLNPERVTHVEDAVSAAAELHSATRVHEPRPGAVLQGRLGATAGDGWMPTILLAPHADEDQSDVAALATALCERPKRRAVAAVLGSQPSDGRRGWQVTLTDDGTLHIPALDLTVQACQLSAQQAIDIAALLAFERTAEDVPMPTMDGLPPPTPTRSDRAPIADADHADAVGTSPADGGRRTLGEPGPGNIAPLRQAPRARSSRPGESDLLDRDLADWWDPDCIRPRLTLLGPVTLRANGDERSVMKSGLRRRDEEAVAYLATRPNGATVEEAAAALRPDQPDLISARAAVHRVTAGARAWLGVDPSTGEPHLTSGRGGPYILRNVLVDAELFRRLRARAGARGPEGRADLLAALELVTGPPFGQRPSGYEWLEGLDLAYTAAICDVAHQVVTGALAHEDLDAARAASTTALQVSPDDENVLLDAMEVAFRHGNRAEAEAYVARIIAINDGEDEMDLHLSSGSAANW